MLQLCICRDIEHLGSLESTQEARVALGCASCNSYASFEPIVKCDKSCSFGIGRRFVHGKFYTMLKKIKSQKESTNVHDFFAALRPGRQEKWWTCQKTSTVILSHFLDSKLSQAWGVLEIVPICNAMSTPLPGFNRHKQKWHKCN